MPTVSFSEIGSLHAWHTRGMRVSHLGHVAVIAAIVGTLAIFLLPMPHASGPYPVTHGPVTFPRSARMALMVGFAHVILLVFAILISVILFSAQSSPLFGHTLGHVSNLHDRLSPNNSPLRC